MVITRLIGGLGNQLFQYAAARCLAQRHGVPVKLDITPFDTYKLHAYSLSPFQLPQSFATPGELARFCRPSRHQFLRRLGNKLQPYYRQRCVAERQFHYDPNIRKVQPPVCLEGYWQSEKYFQEIEPLLREELVITARPDPVSQRLATAIQNTTSVHIHVRRCDYVADRTTSSIHGLCTLDYYQAAVAFLLTRVHSPHFYVFSDDPEWVHQHLRLDWPTTYVSHNGPGRNYEDMRLMSLCRHHIIANSSFSWWGAWLSRSPDKLIIAPKRWWQTPDRNDQDLIPTGWHRL